MNLTEATIKALQGKLEGRQIKKTENKNISRRTEGLEKNRKAYYFEVGVKDFDAEIDRPVPFYKIPYETVDENTGECQTFDEAFGYVHRYIKNGVNSTYGVIVEVDVTEDEYNNIYNGMSDYYDYSYMYEGKLKYSAYKDKNGDYVVAFDDTVDMKLPESKNIERLGVSKKIEDTVKNTYNKTNVKVAESKKTEDVNSSEFNLYIKPEELSDVNKDSLLFDSDTTIADYREGKYLLSLMVRGSVKIENTENGDVYTNYQSFPDDLVELIKTGKLDDSEVYYIDMNNWFEWFLDEVEGNVADTIWYDVADIEGMLNKPTPEENETELEVIMRDLFDDIVSQFKNGSLEESKNMKGKKTENRRVLGEHLKLKEDKELLAEIDDPEELGEDFYEKICRAYIDTLNLEWVAEDKMNGTVVHGYFEDDDYANKHKSEVNNDNFSDIYYGQYTEKEIEDEEPDYGVYQGWENFYYDYVEDGIKEDMEDIGVYSDGTSDYMAGVNHWDFYISEEDLTKLGLWDEEMRKDYMGEGKKQESVVSDYTLSEIKKVLDSKETEYGYSLKITNSGADAETKTLDLDKSDLQAIYNALSKNKITEDKRSGPYYDLWVTYTDGSSGYSRMSAEGAGEMVTGEIYHLDTLKVNHNKELTEDVSDNIFGKLQDEIKNLSDANLDYKGMCSLIAGYIAGIVGVEDNKEAMAKVNIDTVKEIADAVFNEDDVWEPMDDFIYSEIYDKLGIN